MPPKPRPIKERLLAKVVRQPSGCWEFMGTRNRAGYGYIGRGPKGAGMELAHRAMWQLEHGPIPPGLVVRHRCDNPPCVNPQHLLIGSQSDNLNDGVVRGRVRQGVTHPFAKLTADQARAIRRRGGTGERAADLAMEFGISRRAASNIIAWRTWRSVDS